MLFRLPAASCPATSTWGLWQAAGLVCCGHLSYRKPCQLAGCCVVRKPANPLATGLAFSFGPQPAVSRAEQPRAELKPAVWRARQRPAPTEPSVAASAGSRSGAGSAPRSKAQGPVQKSGGISPGASAAAGPAPTQPALGASAVGACCARGTARQSMRSACTCVRALAETIFLALIAGVVQWWRCARRPHSIAALRWTLQWRPASRR